MFAPRQTPLCAWRGRIAAESAIPALLQLMRGRGKREDEQEVRKVEEGLRKKKKTAKQQGERWIRRGEKEEEPGNEDNNNRNYEIVLDINALSCETSNHRHGGW